MMEQIVLSNIVSSSFIGYNPLWGDEKEDFTLFRVFKQPEITETQETKETQKPKAQKEPTSDEDDDDSDATPFASITPSRSKPQSRATTPQTEPAGDVKYITEGHMHVSSLSWNSTGRLLAVSLGYLNHGGWCLHQGALQVYRVFTEGKQNDLFASETTASCLMTVAAHPTKPTLFVGGTFSGDVIAFSYRSDQTENAESASATITISKQQSWTHHDPIAAVDWIPSGTGRPTDYIVSLGSDGLVLVWSLDNMLTTPVANFAIQSRSKNSFRYGGSCLSLSPTTPGLFLAGVENGPIFRGNLSHAPQWGQIVTLSSKGASEQATNAAEFEYVGHAGPTNAISWGQGTYKHQFVSVGADGMLYMHGDWSKRPLFGTANGGCVSLDWSSRSANLVCVGTSTGALVLYTITPTGFNQHSSQTPSEPDTSAEDGQSKKKGSKSKHTKQSKKAKPIYSVAFSNSNPFVACGDAAGTIYIYELPSSLST
ncbi:putative dynein 2 intermediate chain 2 L homeolog [Blattamonas nauphoetae]|uniref:Dynein 2 intermediate chain 2 L homeolog n=1 Tax=Blattamonas nauphoetae TaxID=2049346 RepID=A0ABQ9XPW7_9EUKA|nr:putative dynein 2 intermediate chain 2 L homeolog [Blattamonas nauphoetae]